MKEHDGIDIPSSTIRLITEKHAYKMANLKKIGSSQEEVLISETDGSMIPIVEIDPIKREAKQDSWKARKVSWKEVSFARGKDKVNRFYAGGIGTVEETGQKMLECALLAGIKEGSYIHAIGSGEIESSHRHVVQKRLKIAGAWWKTDNPNAMLDLRMGRINGYWEAYWNSER